jgi:hypothetical protein
MCRSQINLTSGFLLIFCLFGLLGTYLKESPKFAIYDRVMPSSELLRISWGRGVCIILSLTRPNAIFSLRSGMQSVQNCWRVNVDFR